jgi:hypothetical protein
LSVAVDPVGMTETMATMQAVVEALVATLSLYLCMFPLPLTLYQLGLAALQLLICVLMS